MFNSGPTLGMRAIKDFLISDIKKIERIQRMIAKALGEIWVIMGRKGGGKTATLYWILEQAHKAGRECCIAGPPQKIPSWCQRVMDPAAAPENSVVGVSEAGIQYSARSSMRSGQRDALSILPVLRHSGRLIIAETQHSRILDINFLRLMDCIILKPEPMYHFDERNPMSKVMEVLKPQNPKETLFFNGPWFTLIRHQPLPDCWSNELSMPYKPIHDEGEALRFAEDLIDQDYPLGEIRRIMIARSFNRPKHWWFERLGFNEPIQVQVAAKEKPTPKAVPAPEPPKLRELHYDDEYT